MTCYVSSATLEIFLSNQLSFLSNLFGSDHICALYRLGTCLFIHAFFVHGDYAFCSAAQIHINHHLNIFFGSILLKPWVQ